MGLSILLLLFLISSALGILFLMNFYRDPKRKIPKGKVLVSPADGKIIRVIKTTKKSGLVKKGALGKIHTLTKGIAPECYVISIFMSPFDVHYNRAPISGKVVSSQHTSGKFYNAADLSKSLLNEKHETVISSGKMKVKVIQIAGFLARRVFCFVQKNQKIEKGQKLGFIALGSQATLIMPSTVKVVVKEGQRVKAGSSIIARL